MASANASAPISPPTASYRALSLALLACAFTWANDRRSSVTQPAGVSAMKPPASPGVRRVCSVSARAWLFMSGQHPVMSSATRRSVGERGALFVGLWLLAMGAMANFVTHGSNDHARPSSVRAADASLPRDAPPLG